MSYILEALRKSERERTRGSVPSLTTPPTAEGPLPVALIAGAGLLGALAVGLVWLLWPHTDESVAAPDRPVNSVVAPVNATVNDPSRSNPRPARPQAAAAERRSDGLAELDPELRRQLPALRMNVVSFSPDPARRFVMINQSILREGQALAGVEVLRIEPNAAVLRYRGSEFRLSP